MRNKWQCIDCVDVDALLLMSTKSLSICSQLASCLRADVLPWLNVAAESHQGQVVHRTRTRLVLQKTKSRQGKVGVKHRVLNPR